MEYTVQRLAQLAGVSTRTLRYYDEIGILKPARINASGYRIYGEKEVNQLQQILFYKALGVDLKKINEIVMAPTFDELTALQQHREKLLDKRDQLNLLIDTVNKTITSKQRSIFMSDKEKFEGFKKKLIETNEETYGKEIRHKYGNSAVDKSNAKIKNMTQREYEAVTELERAVIQTLMEAYQTGDPAAELAQKAADLHRQWLCYYWDQYSKEAHAGVAQMYVADERFTAYYDKHQPGLAAFLKDAIIIYTGMKVD